MVRDEIGSNCRWDALQFRQNFGGGPLDRPPPPSHPYKVFVSAYELPMVNYITGRRIFLLLMWLLQVRIIVNYGQTLIWQHGSKVGAEREVVLGSVEENGSKKVNMIGIENESDERPDLWIIDESRDGDC